MKKSEIIERLTETPISELAAYYLEELSVGGFPHEAIDQLERFRRSPIVENRITALSMLNNYCGAMGLEGDAVALLARGFLSGDSDVYFGAVGILGGLSSRGSQLAGDILNALSLDPLVAKALQMER